MHFTRKVTKDLTWVGADDRRLACFEGVYGVPNGYPITPICCRMRKRCCLTPWIKQYIRHSLRM